MPDVFSKEKRSEIMAKIHQPTKIEDAVRDWLREEGIEHEMYPKVEGRPDVELTLGDGSKFYLFVDGCFWHCCPLHYRRPKSRQEYWVPHVEDSNARREERRRKLPYSWTRIWEHDVRKGDFKRMIMDVLITASYPENGLSF
ncbi:MAG: very short patch repair endonuclease [Candidatus Bathyarchaeota archaeon]|nr:very short patch repair endonuclease [Candidatus Bathyarchaeota archaeon]MDH5686954.1 very short patch repair endonuclease [Candidatus Bathyarchaeota archaeon]